MKKMYLNDHVFKCLSKTSDMYILFPGDVTYDHSIQKKILLYVNYNLS